MEKVQWNSIKKEQKNGLEQSKKEKSSTLPRLKDIKQILTFQIM